MNKFQSWVSCDIAVVITEDDKIFISDARTKNQPLSIHLNEFKRILDLLKERGMI